MNEKYTLKYYNEKFHEELHEKLVEKEEGKGLSTNDYTDEYKTKLNDITLELGAVKLTTVDKTVIGAINEVYSSID